MYADKSITHQLACVLMANWFLVQLPINCQIKLTNILSYAILVFSGNLFLFCFYSHTY